MSKPPTEPETPRFTAVVLVCKDCSKRSSGPKDKPKVLTSELRKLTRDARPRPRIVVTSCLGLCPKGATAVAHFGGDKGPRIAAIASPKQLKAIAR